MYDLEDRTYQLAKGVAMFIKKSLKQLLILNILNRSFDLPDRLVPTILKQMNHLAKKILI